MFKMTRKLPSPESPHPVSSCISPITFPSSITGTNLERTQGFDVKNRLSASDSAASLNRRVYVRPCVLRNQKESWSLLLCLIFPSSLFYQINTTHAPLCPCEICVFSSTRLCWLDLSANGTKNHLCSKEDLRGGAMGVRESCVNCLMMCSVELDVCVWFGSTAITQAEGGRGSYTHWMLLPSAAGCTWGSQLEDARLIFTVLLFFFSFAGPAGLIRAGARLSWRNGVSGSLGQKLNKSFFFYFF